jgi:hypothetical protein
MTLIRRFKSGLNYGLNGFGLLWKQPILLVYLSIPVLLGVTIELILYNLFFFSASASNLFIDGIMMHIWANSGWIRLIGIFLTDTIRLFVTIFAAAALIHHVNHIMRGERATISHCLRKTLPKTKTIFLWALSATIFFVLIHPVDQIIMNGSCSSCHRLAFTISAIARIAWSLATAFVVVCITLESLPLRQIMRMAPLITKKMLLEYLGGLCWLGLVIILGMTPILLIHFTSPTAQTLMYIIMTMGSCILSTVYVILQVTLYRVAKNSAMWDKIMTFPPL